MTVLKDRDGAVRASTDDVGKFRCALCGVWVQRTSTGDIRDGVRAHYRTVHPGRKIR